MTPYAALLALAGLSHREAADFHRVRPDTVSSWASGRRTAPDGAIAGVRDLIRRQERAAAEAVGLIRQKAPSEIELGVSADNSEAQTLGWPSARAHAAVLARVVASVDIPVRVVPHGSGDGGRTLQRCCR
jgi:hypothetical protein